MMKTLIFNGSPRKQGDTVALINEFTNHLEGEYKVINAYESGIQPCLDCRFCWENKGCCIDDNMQDVYAYIQECDNILVASPLYFSELTGQLLAITSRLQTYFCSRFFRNENPIEKDKIGGVLITGGGDGKMERAYSTAKIILHHMNVKEVKPLVTSHDTNNKPAKEDLQALQKTRELAALFNRNK